MKYRIVYDRWKGLPFVVQLRLLWLFWLDVYETNDRNQAVEYAKDHNWKERR